MSYDAEKINSLLRDEAGQMPITFNMNGAKFRWEVLKMAYEMSHPKSIERIKQTAEDMIEWVNQPPKTFKTNSQP